MELRDIFRNDQGLDRSTR